MGADLVEAKLLDRTVFGRAGPSKQQQALMQARHLPPIDQPLVRGAHTLVEPRYSGSLTSRQMQAMGARFRNEPSAWNPLVRSTM